MKDGMCCIFFFPKFSMSPPYCGVYFLSSYLYEREIQTDRLGGGGEGRKEEVRKKAVG